MKKLLLALITSTLLFFPALAQEAEEANDENYVLPQEEIVYQEPESFEIQDTESTEGLSMKIGGNFAVALPLGSLADFAGAGFGGEIDYELGIPVPLLQHLPFAGMLFRNFAVNAGITFNYHLPKSDDLSGVMDLQIAATALTLIPVAETGLSVVPQFGIGMVINLPQESTEPKALKSAYVDQLYTLGLGLRYSNEKILDNRLEFALTIAYSISPEQDDAVQNLAFKLGALYRFK